MADCNGRGGEVCCGVADVLFKSATTGRAGGMRKAPKRGRGVGFVWQSANQLRHCSRVRAAQIVNVHRCHTSKSSLPCTRKHLLCLPPANTGGDEQHFVLVY
jgi:hypothetical protein